MIVKRLEAELATDEAQHEELVRQSCAVGSPLGVRLTCRRCFVFAMRLFHTISLRLFLVPKQELDDWIAERYSELLAVASSPADSSGGIGPSSSYKTYLWGDSEEHLGENRIHQGSDKDMDGIYMRYQF